MKYVRESHGLKIRAIGFFYTQSFFYILYVFKGAKLAKFIRFEAGWKLMRDEIRDTRCEVRDASISITKFAEMGEMIVFLSTPRNIEDVLGSA